MFPERRRLTVRVYLTRLCGWGGAPPSCMSPAFLLCVLKSLKNQITQKTAEVTLQDALPVSSRTKTTVISE